MLDRSQWNQVLSLLVELHNETQDQRLAGLHAMVVGYAISDHGRQLNVTEGERETQ